ncbi:MAG: quercetin 2,3-dioxygenase [Bacteroidetes bacterium]|jgi:mannose-6-phosphate isomerase-like protein (cupin superfamily)|nr:quercetin 2,3-dioxygenase [Bacteroidota bacterium]
MQHSKNHNDSIILPAGEGRIYNCGTMTAVFKADENETDNKYSVSEWWLEPHSGGPGAHQHEENDEVFYVLEGITSLFVGDKWIDAEKGTFIRIPAKTIHDFANRADKKTGVLNFFIPGGFERNMPSIVKWFEDNK